MLVRVHIEAGNQEGNYRCRLGMPGGSEIGLDVYRQCDEGGTHLKRVRFVHPHNRYGDVPVYGLPRTVPDEVLEIVEKFEFPNPDAYNTDNRTAVFETEVDSPTAIESLQKAATKSRYVM